MTPNGSMARIKVAAVALGFLMSGVLAPSTSEARGETGPNDGGVLIVHTSSTEFTTDEDYCGMSGLGDCEDAVTQAEPGTEVVAHILAAFPATPRLRGVTFGVDYPVNTSVLSFGSCADFEVSDGGWPAAGNGTALTWLDTQTDEIVEVYWCGLYVDGVDPAVFELIPSPTQGGFFADDSIPAVLDPIADYGALGFATNGTLHCPEPLFACCFADGSCSVLTVSECESTGGTPEESDSSCEPNPCPQPEGACCFTDGSCGVFTAESCDERRGVYQGDDTSCDPNPCPQLEGACCFDDGSCGSLTEESCDVDGGTYQGDGTSCNPNPCPQPEGACCLDDGSCRVFTVGSCDYEGGTYQGDDTSCDPNPCPPAGACCFSDGSCSLLLELICEGQEGTYQGDSTGCSPNPCPQLIGACCLQDGSCVVLSYLECDQQDGSFLGEDVPCKGQECADLSGACCFVDRTCLFVTQAECAAIPGYFLGPAVPCDPNPCPGERGCSDPRPMNERNRPEIARRPGSGPSPFAETGRGQGVVTTSEFRGRCDGTLHFHADGTYENGYTWQYGGVVPPLYGAFAELYPIGVARPCAIVLDLSQVGGASGQTADLYVWQSTNGLPGAVIGFRPDVDPGPVAFWPSLSRHALEIDSNCSFGDEFFVGYWANWPSAVAGWYVGADTDGFGGGCSLTKIAPGQGFPTGWQDVSVAWGPTQSLGIGVEVHDCNVSPIRESSWGRIKSLFR